MPRNVATLSLVSLGALLLAASTALGQACNANVHGRTNTVSVADLHVSAKAWGHFEKARQASEAGNDATLEREADLTLAAAPDFVGIYVLRAARQVETHHDGEAIRTIEAARRIRPEVPFSSIVLAQALSGQGRFDEAVADLARARGADTQSWQWKFERTRAEIGRRDAEAALHWSALAFATMPEGCKDGYILRMNALQLAGQLEDAITLMRAYLALESPLPKRAQVESVLASTQAQLQAKKNALVAER